MENDFPQVWIDGTGSWAHLRPAIAVDFDDLAFNTATLRIALDYVGSSQLKRGWDDGTAIYIQPVEWPGPGRWIACVDTPAIDMHEHALFPTKRDAEKWARARIAEEEESQECEDDVDW